MAAAKKKTRAKTKTKIEPTTTHRAKGRTFDVTNAKRVSIEPAVVEKNLGLPLGPVMRALIEMACAVDPSEPALAFRWLDGVYLELACFHSRFKKIAYDPPKGAHPFATSDKNAYAFWAPAGTSHATTDDCPILYLDGEGGDDPRFVAADLATWLSALAFATGMHEDDRAIARDVARLQRNLRLLPAVTRAKAKAKLPKTLEDFDPEAAALSKQATQKAKQPAAAGGNPKMNKLAGKLLDKASDKRFMDDKKALAFAQQALDLGPAGDVLENAESAVLDLMADLGKRKEAAALLARVLPRWIADVRAGSTWNSVAECLGKLDIPLPPEVAKLARRAWATARTQQDIDHGAHRKKSFAGKPPADPGEALDQARFEIGAKDLARALACLAVAKKATGDDERKAYEAHALEAVAMQRLADPAAARATWTKALDFATRHEAFGDWEALACVFLLLDIDDAKARERLAKAWKKRIDDAPVRFLPG